MRKQPVIRHAIFSLLAFLSLGFIAGCASPKPPDELSFANGFADEPSAHPGME